MRSLTREVLKYGTTSRGYILSTPMANYYYAWIKQKSSEPREYREALPKDIISLRKMFYEEYYFPEVRDKYDGFNIF